ncbi:MAG: GNAT family N-acetyltransferase [Actinomycetota bacterium]|nr:GNAT family N-acetyltransferase [Actinomycetota bacterium]
MTTAPVAELRAVAYDHPDVVVLTERAQQVYVRLYGGRDATPVDAADFTPPGGAFFVAYVGGVASAMGGWRLLTPRAGLPGVRPAEIKRMYVTDPARRRGLARLVLAHLEATARQAGVDWMLLETGRPQVEAVGLYRSSGYIDVAKFGHYADEPDSVNLGRPLRRTG